MRSRPAPANMVADFGGGGMQELPQKTPPVCGAGLRAGVPPKGATTRRVRPLSVIMRLEVMVMTIVLDGELEARLRAEAARRGTDPETLVRRTLEDRWPPEQREYGYLQRTLSPEEWSRQAHEWAASHRPWPDLPDEAISREGIYGDHP
jgi:hypothetical protein